MIEFNQSVQLRRRTTASTGEVSVTTATSGACIVHEERELADDHHGPRRKITLLLPGNAALQPGDGVVCNGTAYEIFHVRQCRDVGGENLFLRVQGVF